MVSNSVAKKLNGISLHKFDFIEKMVEKLASTNTKCFVHTTESFKLGFEYTLNEGWPPVATRVRKHFGQPVFVEVLILCTILTDSKKIRRHEF